MLAGLVASFILGWLVYDVALKSYYDANSMAGLNKPAEERIIWAMILGMLSGVFLLNWLLNMGGASHFMAGAKIGAMVFGLMALSYDSYFYASTNLFTKPELICVDSLASAIQGAIVGGVIGWVRGMVDKPAATAS